MKKVAKVVLAGRTNVGKSSLFNRISSNVQSITMDQEGVTRDVIKDIVTWNGMNFELVDSGGITAHEPKQDFLAQQVRQKAIQEIEQAAVVVFVCDGQVGVTNEDMQLIRFIKKHTDHVIVAVNKIDAQVLEDEAFGYETLGGQKIFYVSAVHGRNVGDILDYVTHYISEHGYAMSGKEDSDFRVVLLGKPNVGKSSLMNLLARQEVSIVSPIEGTTREPIRQRLQVHQQPIDLIDTAGVRRKASVHDDLETLMVKSSLEAVRRAHIVLLLMSADEPYLSNQVLKLASYVFEQGAALILLLNKTDLLDDEKNAQFKDSVDQYKFIVDKLETLKISCKDGKNIGKIMPLVQKVWEAHNQYIAPEILSHVLLTALIHRPLYKNQVHLQFFGAKQIGRSPMRIELDVMHPQLWEDSHKSYLENVLRKEYDLKSCPIIFSFKDKKLD